MVSKLGLFKVGLAGCGQVAHKHVMALRQLPGAILSGVYDPDLDRAETFSRRYNIPYFTSYQDLLASGIDAVAICSPSWLHASMGIEAAEKGIHVVVEKPMALTLEEADNLIAACEDNKVVLTVVLQNRFKPAVKLLRSAVEAGRFGKLSHGSAIVRWNRNREYYLNNPWRERKELGGGALINQAIHNLDLLLWMMGSPSSVFAYTANRVSPGSAEDLAVGIIRFKNGALGTIEVSSSIYPRNLEESLAIFGEKGTAVLSGTTASTMKTWIFEDGLRDDLGLKDQEFKGHLEVYQDFLRAVRRGEKPFVDGREGRKSLALILALHESALTKREVVLSEWEV